MNELYDVIVYGFIDPVTAGFVISAGSKIVGSMMGPGEDELREAEEAAKEVSFSQKKSVGQELRLGQESAKLKTDSLMNQATSRGQDSLLGLLKQKDSAVSSSGFESDDSTTASANNTRSQVYESYGDTVDTIVAEANLTKQSTDLNMKKKIENIENELDKNISNILSTPDTFLEKFTGQSDYEFG